MNFTKALLATSLITASTFAVAMPITGSISFTGSVINDDASSTLSFANVKTGPINTGTYEGLNNIEATMSDIVYSPLFSASSDTLWSFIYGENTYSFEVLTLSGNSQELDMMGSGVLKATGFDDTEGFWEYSTQLGNTFSAGNIPVPIPVPEPATLGLLGIGIAGLALARRKQANKA
ncbi:MAG: PEP-CTERM sorting domain-containing protein [Saccharospirillum sp.]|nr:PEP-CTERM sorting domain-containing protein [Saccharospirillum sp.]